MTDDTDDTTRERGTGSLGVLERVGCLRLTGRAFQCASAEIAA
jgi:hypothetical protein